MDEQSSLKVVFYIFLFFLFGILCRHMAITYRMKTSYLAALFLIGTLLGVLSKVIDDLRNPILSQCGPFCLQTVYVPLYFFESGFQVEAKDLKPKIYVFTFCILLPTWILTVTVITAVGMFWFPFDLRATAYVILVTLSMTPDVQATRMFFMSKTSSVHPGLVTLLEFESLVCSALASVSCHYIMLQDIDLVYLATLPFEIVLSIPFGVVLGQVVTFWLKKSHHDIVIQTTVTLTFIFVTFSVSYSLELVPGLAVLLMSIVLMRNKPSISVKSIGFMHKFIEVFRFLMINILSIVVGMQLVTRVATLIEFQYIYLSILLYAIFLLIRLVVLLALRPVYGRYCFSGMHDLLMIWTCNIRGPYNVAMSFAFIASGTQNRSFYADDRLLLLATFQIALSLFVSTPAAGLVMAGLRMKTIDYEKLAMIYRCANVLSDIKISMVSILKKMWFSAGADWDMVQQRTKMKKRFLNYYGQKQFIRDMKLMNLQTSEKRIRSDSIRVMLRTQRHYLGDQFEKGLVTSSTAQHLTEVITNSYTNKSIPSSEQVIEKMAPKKYLLNIHRELEESLKRTQTLVRRQTSWILLILTLFLSTLRIQTIIFRYSEHFALVFVSIWIYHVLFTIGVIIYACILVLRRQVDTFTWLLVATGVFSCLEVLSDLFVYQEPFFQPELKLTSYQKAVWNRNIFLSYLEIGFSVVTLSLRILSVAFCLSVVKQCLCTLVNSLLVASVYVQCEAGLSYTHITKDSLHQLPDCVLDSHLMRSMQLILHQEHLSAKQYMGFLEILTPEILTALKTYIASRLILNSQSHQVTKMRDQGVLEDADYKRLISVVQNKIRCLRNLPVVMKTPSVKQLLDHLPGLWELNLKTSALMRFGEILHYKPGQVLLHQTQDPMGLFIILQGLVRIECCTILSMHSDVRPIGPVYYISNNASDQSDVMVELTNFYSPGAVVGVRTILTDKPGHKTVRCVTHVQALFAPRGLIHQLMSGRPKLDGPISQLEKNMWRVTAIRQAARLIQGSLSTDVLLSRRKVYHMMEHASLIFGEPGNALRLDVRQYLAVILVHGSVWALDRQYHYESPCFIPNRISQHELVVGRAVRTVLLVLPAADEGEQEDREWNFMRQRDMYMTRVNDDDDEMTPSSDSSDGIPHKRYRDTLATMAGD